MYALEGEGQQDDGLHVVTIDGARCWQKSVDCSTRVRMGDGGRAVALFCLRFAMAGLDSHTLAFSLPRCQLAFWPPPGAMLAGGMVQRECVISPNSWLISPQ